MFLFMNIVQVLGLSHGTKFSGHSGQIHTFPWMSVNSLCLCAITFLLSAFSLSYLSRLFTPHSAASVYLLYTFVQILPNWLYCLLMSTSIPSAFGKRSPHDKWVYLLNVSIWEHLFKINKDINYFDFSAVAQIHEYTNENALIFKKYK